MDNAAVGRAALAKAWWRLIPFLFVLYIVAAETTASPATGG